MIRHAHLLFILAVTLASIMSKNLEAESFLGNGKANELFQAHCASCHGQQLEGGMAGSLLDDIWTTASTDEALSHAIKFGLDGTNMPSWKSVLSDDDIRTLVLLIREKAHLAKQANATAVDVESTFTSRHHSFDIETMVDAQGIIWAIDFLPDESLIYSQRNGSLWLYNKNGHVKIEGTPQVWHHDQGGLLDVAVHPEFTKNGWVYLSYAVKTGKNAEGKDTGTTAVVRGQITDNRWQQQEVIYLPEPSKHVNRGWHFGSRFAFKGPYLYFSIGDEGYKDTAQSLSHHSGKIHRIYDDGRIPEDNPFVGVPDAEPSVWTYGNRNPQGMTVNAFTNQLWSAEHGPRGGDELNLVLKANNYGWPVATFGMNYDGTSMKVPTHVDGVTAPVHQWTPSIAVSDITFYSGDKFPQWKGNLFAGSLAFQQLHRLEIKNDQVVNDEILLSGMGRIRDVTTGPDGYLYIAINDKVTSHYRVVALKPIANQ